MSTDISLASTIPSNWYFDLSRFDHECSEIFAKSWNLVGHVSQVRELGDYFTCRVAFENVLVVATENGPVAYSNVCRHRAGPVAKGCGKTKVFQCAYHGWIYNLKGELQGTPEFQEVQNFKKEECPLPKFKLGILNGFIYVALNPKVSFEEFSGHLSQAHQDSGFEKFEQFLAKDYHVECNWKIYVDNYLEGYHIPLVHKGLMGELDYSQYKTETFKWFSSQIAPARMSADLYKTEHGSEAHYYWLFPNTMYNIYQGMVQTNVVVPLTPTSCVVRFAWYKDPWKDISEGHTQKLIEFSDLVQEEDRLICEEVQKNLRSSTYDQGRYSVKRENGLFHFHELLRNFEI